MIILVYGSFKNLLDGYQTGWQIWSKTEKRLSRKVHNTRQHQLKPMSACSVWDLSSAGLKHNLEKVQNHAIKLSYEYETRLMNCILEKTEWKSLLYRDGNELGLCCYTEILRKKPIDYWTNWFNRKKFPMAPQTLHARAETCKLIQHYLQHSGTMT